VRPLYAALVALLALLPPLAVAPQRAAASCGSENCPVDHAARWDESMLSFEISEQYSDQDQPRVGTHDAAVGAIPAHHDEVRTVNRITTARVGYRPAAPWSFSASLPYVNRTHEHVHNHMGVPFYMRWSYQGVGDLETSATRRFGAEEGRARFFASAGVKAPTGLRSVEEVDGDQPEPSARPGTGSWDFLAGLGAEWRLSGSGPAEQGGVPLRLSVNGRWNGRGTERYQVGSELAAHLATEIPATTWGSVLLQTNFKVRAKDDVGNFSAEEGNTGGTALFVTPGVRIDAGRLTSITALVQLPIYQRVNGIQLVSEANLYVGVTHALLR
jgi:hypothetical protein